MVEELKIIQQIFGDLTGLGVWAIVCLFAYKAMWFAGFVYVVKMVYELCVKLFCCEVSKSDYNEIRKDHEESRAAAAKAKEETERVLHMYSILKEAKYNGNE
jgi:hypothetical protein